MSKKVNRLIEQFVPENYKLSIEINPDEMTFSGNVVVRGKKIGRPSQRLTFHQNDISITSAQVTKIEKTANKTIAVDRINKQNKYQEVRLHADTMLYPGEYEVVMFFSGQINNNMNGLYPCYYEYEGKQKKLFATQFESHHAREVFPCIDEPLAKATFDLKLTAPDDGDFLSNMPEKSTKSLPNGLVEKTFEKTPIMSTYLLAFVYGDIHCVESQTKTGVKVRIWATVAQKKENLKYALKEAVAIQDFFEEYFKTPFPLKKCDHIALPDFDAGAMENWGLITYREVGLLNDPENRSVPSEQYTSLVIAHELSHQWFGNLVTMAWWDDLWLNESFASIMEHIPLDNLHPDWHQWESYTAYDVISASNRDVFADVQNVGIGVNHPDEIRSLFDGAIVYSKGGRLVKMMREYVGDEVLRKALHQYFKKLAYKNATREDLWQAIAEASGQEISKLMTPWIEQSGMPILTVTSGTSESERIITQKRFIFDKENDSQLWPVPLLSDVETKPSIISEKQNKVVFKDGDSGILINKNGSGHYLVKYEEKDDFDNLIIKLQNQSIGTEARINVLNDNLLMARHGDVSLVDVLNLVKPMSNEPRDVVWDMIIRTIGYASAIGENNDIIENGIYKLRHRLSILNYKKLGFLDKDNDDPNTKSLRSTMLSMLLGSKDKETINFVLDYFKKTPIDKIPADRRSTVFSTVVKYGKSNADISMLLKLYKSSQNPDLLNAICVGICSTESPALAKKVLEEGLCERGYVKPQDYFRWFAYLSRNKYTRDVTWEWMTKDWERLLEKFSGGINIEAFITYSAGPIYTKEQQKRFNDFFENKKSVVRVSRDIKIAQSEIQARVEWRSRDLKKIESFFKALQ